MISSYLDSLNKNGYNQLWYKGNIFIAKKYLNEDKHTDLMKVICIKIDFKAIEIMLFAR